MDHNPNVKTKWTKEEMDLIAEQIDKYHRVVQGEKAEEVFGFADHCLICDACGDSECEKCPLINGGDYFSCTEEPTYIDRANRHSITSKQARSRRDYLVRRINESGAGIEIYFE